MHRSIIRHSEVNGRMLTWQVWGSSLMRYITFAEDLITPKKTSVSVAPIGLKLPTSVIRHAIENGREAVAYLCCRFVDILEALLHSWHCIAQRRCCYSCPCAVMCATRFTLCNVCVAAFSLLLSTQRPGKRPESTDCTKRLADATSDPRQWLKSETMPQYCRNEKHHTDPI